MNSIQVVLTDISLPHMDGIALVRALKKMKPGGVYIASTGQSEHFRGPELQNLGVGGLLTKPYDSQKLLEALRGALCHAAQ